MFLHIFGFEVRYWLRRPMVYIFLLVNFLFIFGATCSDSIQIGGAVGNVHKNAPYIIQNWFGTMGLIFGLMMTAAFMQGAALRDFDNNTYQIVFASPISRASYYFGRFLGAATVSVIPFFGVGLGVLLGSIIAPLMGWADAERFGAMYWLAYADSFTVLIIPLVLIAGGIIFTIAALTRSTMAAFISALTLLMAYAISGVFLRDLDNENVLVFTDIFGLRALGLTTKYWTVEQKNTASVGFFYGKMFINRTFWLAIGAAIVGIGYFRFSFTEKTSTKKTKNKTISTTETPKTAFTPTVSLPAFESQTGLMARLSQIWTVAKIEYFAIAKDTTFIVLLFIGVLNMVLALIFSKGGYGLTQYPVTYSVLEIIAGSMQIFLLAKITFASGQVVWRERDAHFEQIHDALPYPTWVSYGGKFAALLGIVFTVQTLKMVCGIAKQAFEGYYNFEIGQYLVQLFLQDAFLYVCMIALSMLIHTLVNNKYIAFFAFILFMVVFNFIWIPLDVTSKMVQLFEYPSNDYSDMAGYGPSQAAKLWFMGYWLLFSAILASISIAFWVRGKDDSRKSRWNLGKLALSTGGLRVFALSTVVLFIATGSWIFYNTKVLNSYITPKAQEKKQVAYEKAYKKFENVATPTLVDIVYNVDIFPKERNLHVKAAQTWVNKTTKPIDSLHFSMLPDGEVRFHLEIAKAKCILNDTLLGYQIYKLEQPLQPNDTLHYTYTADKTTKGFENSSASTEVVENGTFFNSGFITPSIGYQESAELGDKNDRKKYGLSAKSDLMPRLPAKGEPCGEKCTHTYLDKNSNWVTMTTTISTTDDQIAVAPGSLTKEWKADGRNYYTYTLDKASMFFGAFMSARYTVKRAEWNGVKLEVYYDAKHPYNVDRILNSMRKSLQYYTTNYGPYYHKQCRVIEFPRYASFAQAFPGTMPYSEGIGFIDKYDEKEDIDKVFYVVAHEIGHQYWAHQVVGANVQGATLLSETFAQYSALMVMEHEYGHEAMRKFLKYESDNFLRSRGGERLKENPLMKVESSQGYIHYRKGSMVMFYLKEMIGEGKINEALRELIANYAYKEPPYPVSHAAVDAFAARTPDSLKYLITDLFETITIFDNRTLEAKTKKLPSGEYETTLKVQSEKFRADSLGKESPIAINDWIEVGVFAAPADGKKYGKPLELRRVKINRKEQSFTFKTKMEPYEAGIDPNCYLIDKVVGDNVKKVTIE